jgi:hypothetical protein
MRTSVGPHGILGRTTMTPRGTTTTSRMELRGTRYRLQWTRFLPPRISLQGRRPLSTLWLGHLCMSHHPLGRPYSLRVRLPSLCRWRCPGSCAQTQWSPSSSRFLCTAPTLASLLFSFRPSRQGRPGGGGDSSSEGLEVVPPSSPRSLGVVC